MTALEAALALVAEHEFSNRPDGGFTDDPADHGGATKFGISLRFLQTIDPTSTVDDIREMTWARASSILEVEFWQKNRYDTLPADVAVKLFDLAVNMGSKRAHVLLQRACRSCSDVVEEDGVLGPLTRASVASALPYSILACLRCEAAGFYRVLAARTPSQERFLKGWLDRAYA